MPKHIFSAPGRVEIGGNHTDHQHGRVLAAAIDLETRCEARVNGTNIVRINDKRFGVLDVDLSELDVRDSEKGSSESLVRGVAAWFKNNGHAIGGFDAEASSNIPAGAGLSSSAAFEVLLGNVFKGLFGADVTPLDIALAGQFAENVYFGKPCGLMDQTSCSFGGLTMIDFYQPQNPVITPIQSDLSGFALCVVSTGGSHADLTSDYAAIPSDMKSIALHFGKEYLRDISPGDFYSAISELRYLGDRAILRAIHFFEENERVLKQVSAIESGNMKEFIYLIGESGKSSLAYLQNVYSPMNPQQQGLTLALALSERVLSGAGAWRVHGGGFAGTILAFVPYCLKEEYQCQMNKVFGEDCCHFLNIRKT